MGNPKAIAQRATVLFLRLRRGFADHAGLIAGRLPNSQTGARSPAPAWPHERATGLGGSATSDARGAFSLPLLSPGQYRVRTTAEPIARRQELQLNRGALELNFRLRPLSDVWESGQYRSVFLPEARPSSFYGPDVDTSRSGSTKRPEQTRRSRIDNLANYRPHPASRPASRRPRRLHHAGHPTRRYG
jgi:hypothetical protein